LASLSLPAVLLAEPPCCASAAKDLEKVTGAAPARLLRTCEDEGRMTGRESGGCRKAVLGSARLAA